MRRPWTEAWQATDHRSCEELDTTECLSKHTPMRTYDQSNYSANSSSQNLTLITVTKHWQIQRSGIYSSHIKDFRINYFAFKESSLRAKLT